MRYPNLSVFEFLLDSLKVKYDDTDFMGRNPFMLNVQIHHSRPAFFPAVEKLLQKGIKFDLADSSNRTPFLIFYDKSNVNSANRMLDMGANIN